MKRLVSLAVTTTFVAAAIGVVGAGSASAAACTASPIETWRAYNVNCSYVQHWDKLSGNVYQYAPRVSPQTWSNQGACWAGVVSYGANKGVKVDYV
jgi:hypothetical protein